MSVVFAGFTGSRNHSEITLRCGPVVELNDIEALAKLRFDRAPITQEDAHVAA